MKKTSSSMQWFSFGNMPLQCFEHRAKRGGKNGFSKTTIFLSSFLNHFWILSWQTKVWWSDGLGFPSSFGLWTWLMVFWPFVSTFLFIVDYWTCWALDPWWINKVLDSVCRAPKKWASTVCMHINIFILSNAFLVSTLHKDSHSISSPKSSWKNNFLHRVYITLLLWEERCICPI